MTLKLITLFFLFIFLSNHSNGQSTDLVNFYTTTSTSKAILPDSVLLGEGSASFITKSGTFFYVDNSGYKVLQFAENGKLIRSFGRKGRGPGDFLEITDIYVDNEKLYLLDYKNARFQLFNINNGKFINTINLEFTPSINNEFIVVKDSIYLLGSIPDNELFVHKLDLKGNLEESFGKFIDFSNFFMTTNGKIQLTQLHAAKDDDQIIFTLGAPYRMFSYTFDQKSIWKNEDPILPKPWIDHIKVTPTSYRAKFYPTSFNSEVVDDYLIVYWLDPEKKFARLDLRNKSNGNLIQRSAWSYENALISISKAEESKSFYVLTKNRSTTSLFLHRLKLKVVASSEF